MGATRTTLLLLLGCIGFTTFTARGTIENSDGEICFYGARAWVLRGDPGMVRESEVATLLEPGAPTFPAEFMTAEEIHRRSQTRGVDLGKPGRNGRTYAWFPIGYQALLMPCVVLGDVLAGWFPAPEQAYQKRIGNPYRGEFYWGRFVASFVSPLAGAISLVALLWLARTLGAGARESLLVVFTAALCTQFWPGLSETVSNPPAATGLILAVLAIARYATGAWSGRWLLLAGICGGAAVALRHDLAVTLAFLCLWVLQAALRRRRVLDVLWLAAGGLPFAVGVLTANWLRFGSVTDTGFPSGFGEGVFLLGLLGFTISPGKSLLWFSPPLLFGLASYCRRSTWTVPTALLLTALLTKVLLLSSGSYWTSGRCWGNRYPTVEIVLLVLFVLLRVRPWQQRAWLRLPFVAVTALGFIITLGGVLAPYTGQQHLAFAVVKTMYGPAADDINVIFAPRLSPLHTHWTYLDLALRGELAPGTPAGRADLVEQLFGVRPQEPVAPLPPEDRDFNHVWWRFLALDIPGFPVVWVGLSWLLGTLGALALGLRAWRRLPSPA